jgi:hypothetical protein
MTDEILGTSSTVDRGSAAVSCAPMPRAVIAAALAAIALRRLINRVFGCASALVG